MKITTDGLDTITSNLEQLAELKGIDIGSVLRDEAGLFAKQAVSITPPYSAAQLGIENDSSSAKTIGKNAVKRDIARVFYSPAAAFKAMKVKDAKAAKAFWKHCKKGEYREAEKLIQSVMGDFTIRLTSLPIKAIHDAARNRRGVVRDNWRTIEVVTDASALKAYIDRKVSHVGITRSPWAKVANALGKPMPSWMTDHPESSPILDDKTKAVFQPAITVGTKVPWADGIQNFMSKLEAAAKSRGESIDKKLAVIIEGKAEGKKRWRG